MPIEIKNATFKYAVGTPFEKTALNNVSLDINEKDLWLFVGHTGSGKSTLINTLNGLIIPQEGTISVDGQMTNDKNSNIKDLRKKIGLVFQYPEAQFFLPTVIEEFLYAPKNFGMDLRKEEIDFYMKLFGLPYDYLQAVPFNLSGGEMRKVAIISVLCYNPSYIILDEPTVGLDYTTRLSVFNAIKRLNSMGKTIVLVTHWISDFISLNPKMLVMKDGSPLFIGTMEEFVKLDDEILRETGIKFDEKLELYKKAVLNNSSHKEKIASL